MSCDILGPSINMKNNPNIIIIGDLTGATNIIGKLLLLLSHMYSSNLFFNVPGCTLALSSILSASFSNINFIQNGQVAVSLTNDDVINTIMLYNCNFTGGSSSGSLDIGTNVSNFTIQTSHFDAVSNIWRKKMENLIYGLSGRK